MFKDIIEGGMNRDDCEKTDCDSCKMLVDRAEKGGWKQIEALRRRQEAVTSLLTENDVALPSYRLWGKGGATRRNSARYRP